MASSGFPEYLGLQYEWVKEDRAAYPSQQPLPPFPAAIGSRYRYISSCSSSVSSRKFYWLINVTWCRSGWEMRLGIRWDSKGKLCYNSCCLCLSITVSPVGLKPEGLSGAIACMGFWHGTNDPWPGEQYLSQLLVYVTVKKNGVCWAEFGNRLSWPEMKYHSYVTGIFLGPGDDISTNEAWPHVLRILCPIRKVVSPVVVLCNIGTFVFALEA